MLPEKDEDAVSTSGLSFFIIISICIITLLIVVFFNRQIAALLGNPEISNWLYVIPIAVLVTGIFNTLKYWASRKKQFKRLAARTVSQSISTAGVKLGMGLAGLTKSGLIIGTIAGQFIATSVLGWLLWKDDRSRFRSVTKNRIKQMQKNTRIFQNFPLFRVFLMYSMHPELCC